MTSALVQEKTDNPSDFSTGKPDEQPEIGRRLKQVREKRRWSQPEMAAHIGVSSSYVWQLEAGTKKPGPKIIREIEMMEKAPASRADKPLPKAKPDGDIMRDVEFVRLRYMPVVAWSRAGSAIAYDEVPAEALDHIPTDVADPKAFAISVRGDSMDPDIREGDCAILLPSEEAKNGDVAVLLLRDDSVILKQVQFSGDRRTITLISFNPEYKPRELLMQEVARIVPVHAVWKPVREA